MKPKGEEFHESSGIRRLVNICYQDQVSCDPINTLPPKSYKNSLARALRQCPQEGVYYKYNQEKIAGTAPLNAALPVNKEADMGTVKDIKKNYCDDVFTGLSAAKNGIVEMKNNLAGVYDTESELFRTYERHLSELIEQIDWKLQILSHACPYDWKGSSEYEEGVSVGPTGTAAMPEFSGGYVGG